MAAAAEVAESQQLAAGVVSQQPVAGEEAGTEASRPWVEPARG